MDARRKPKRRKGGARRLLRAAEIEEVFRRLGEAIPDPRTELRYRTPLDLLVAVMLSAQATDRAVNEATPALFRRCRKAEDYVALGADGIIPFIRSIGLYNTKARNIARACRLLVERHGGAVPEDRAALEDLPGVGRKTAGVVLHAAFGHPTLPVDTHVFRVANRLGLARTRTPGETEDALLAVVPERYLRAAHHLLILHGRYTCKALKPRCPECPLWDLCPYEPKAG